MLPGKENLISPKNLKMTNRAGHGNIFDDPQKKKEMISHYVEGYSCPQIALYYEVHHTTILYHVQKAGVCRVDKKIRDKIICLVKKGMSTQRVAQKFKILEPSVSAICVMKGIPGCKIYPIKKQLVLKIAPRSGGFRRQISPPVSFKKTPNSERLGWMKHPDGEWVRTGRSIEQIQKEQEERRRTKEFSKREDLLKY